MKTPKADYLVRTHGGRGGRVFHSFGSLLDAVDYAKQHYNANTTVNAQPVLYLPGIEYHITGERLAFIPLGGGFVRAFSLDLPEVKAKAKGAA